MVCNKPPKAIELDENAFRRWQAGDLIQRCFPDMDEDTREILITGTHPACFETIFEGMEDDGEY
jgi:hypothetical protein